jgi:hypothetical protein
MTMGKCVKNRRGMLHIEQPNRAELRKARAAEREAARENMSPADKLEALDKRLGAGVGAKKERARLVREASRWLG